jgi:membrane protein DedA with SNARE-associated domain
MAGIIEWITVVITGIISVLGYPGIILLMALESACIPIPSEIVMPFAGYLASNGTFDLVGLTLAGTAGNLIGSIVAYWIGLKAGRPFVLKYGRYVLLRKKHLDLAEAWFAKHGESTTLFSRMLPIVRTFISLPAGMAKMDFKKFVLFTTIGSIPWNFTLAYIGFQMGQNWEEIKGWFWLLDIIVVVAVVIILAILVIGHLKENGKKAAGAKDEKDGS